MAMTKRKHSLTTGTMDVPSETETPQSNPPRSDETTLMFDKPDMVAFAQKIEHQSRKLCHEQQLLQEAQEELRLLEEKDQQEEGINQNYRRRLLEATNDRNFIELELFEVSDRILSIHSQIQESQQEANKLEDDIETMKSRFELDVHNLFAPREAERELYEKTLSKMIQNRTNQLHEQQQYLDKVQKDVELLEQENSRLLSEPEQLMKASERLQREEHEGAQDIARLAEQVREALATRAELRKNIREGTNPNEALGL